MRVRKGLTCAERLAGDARGDAACGDAARWREPLADGPNTVGACRTRGGHCKTAMKTPRIDHNVHLTEACRYLFAPTSAAMSEAAAASKQTGRGNDGGTLASQPDARCCCSRQHRAASAVLLATVRRQQMAAQQRCDGAAASSERPKAGYCGCCGAAACCGYCREDGDIRVLLLQRQPLHASAATATVATAGGGGPDYGVGSSSSSSSSSSSTSRSCALCVVARGVLLGEEWVEQLGVRQLAALAAGLRAAIGWPPSASASAAPAPADTALAAAAVAVMAEAVAEAVAVAGPEGGVESSSGGAGGSEHEVRPASGKDGSSGRCSSNGGHSIDIDTEIVIGSNGSGASVWAEATRGRPQTALLRLYGLASRHHIRNSSGSGNGGSSSGSSTGGGGHHAIATAASPSADGCCYSCCLAAKKLLLAAADVSRLAPGAVRAELGVCATPQSPAQQSQGPPAAAAGPTRTASARTDGSGDGDGGGGGAGGGAGRGGSLSGQQRSSRSQTSVAEAITRGGSFEIFGA